MKNVLCILLLLGIGYPLFSQQDKEMELVRDIFQLDKAILLADFLSLPKEKMDQLAPIYGAYEEERRTLGNRRIEMLKKYGEQSEKLTAEQADALVKEYFSIRKATLKLRDKYYKKVKKTLGSLTATAFLQFEEYIENSIQSEIWEAVPFVKPKH